MARLCCQRAHRSFLGIGQGDSLLGDHVPLLTYSQKADSLDILLVLLGYILMHITFGRLFLSSRSLGSNFWLMTAILSSSVTAFLLALPLAMYLNIPLDPVSLVEALPFLVCTVGFDKPLRLARAVFTHPHVTRPAVQEGRWRGQMKLAGDVVLEAIDQVGNGILRDYALEIAVLLVGASSRVGGLREFCALAVLALTLDCFMLCTFYTAILAVMIEVSPLVTGPFHAGSGLGFIASSHLCSQPLPLFIFAGSKNQAGQGPYQISP